jgi:hypothetical protein
MSEAVLQKSKLLCYFVLDSSLRKAGDELLEPLTLPLTLFHFHYPPLYYPIVHQHFKNSLPPCTEHQICFTKNGEELAAELPLGLELENNDVVFVNVRQLPVADGFKLTMTSWKKGYSIVNREGGCDHVFKKLNEPQQRLLYNMHVAGHSHGLHKVPKYEGNSIALKIYCQKHVIERKEDDLDLTILQYFRKTFADLIDLEGGVLAHGARLDLNMTLKELLENWNYNDGFCYLKVAG